MPKPVHPAAVHFPLAFLMLGYGIDIVHTLSPQLPKSLTSHLAPAADLTRASFYLIAAGLIMAVPAVLTGVFEATKVAKQGFYESDGKTIKTKVKAMFAHAVVSDIVVAASAYVWSLRRAAANDTLAGKLRIGSLSTPEAAYTPEQWMVAAEGGILLLMMVAANIGGTLAYNFGIGFSSASAGAAKKKN